MQQRSVLWRDFHTDEILWFKRNDFGPDSRGMAVVTAERTVWLVGSNPRGAAFAAYTLSERLGIECLAAEEGIEIEKAL